MPITQESLKYRADVLKYSGFALMTPLAIFVLTYLTDPEMFFKRFWPANFFIACLMFIGGSRIKMIFVY